MYRRKDHDIFGTEGVGFAPRISNDATVDPHAAFRAKTEQNYQQYANRVTNTPQTISRKEIDSSRVNERVDFGEQYHKERKGNDMQSSIFYPPTHHPTVQTHTSPKKVEPLSPRDANYGRKNTFSREIGGLEQNNIPIKGNSSRLFGFEERAKVQTETSINLSPLIPHQMQWDQHDSIRHNHHQPNSNEHKKQPSLEQIEVSKSTYVPAQPEDRPEVSKKEAVKEQEEKGNTLQRAKSAKTISQTGMKKEKEPVEVRILKGWDYKWMEGLSKHAKLSGTAIVKFEAEGQGKALIVLKRTARWENVTDWLRKDAKLRIRVLNA